MKKIMAGIFMMVFLLFFPVSSNAWEQDAHIRINLEAIKKFQQVFGQDEKYTKAPLLTGKTYKGLEVTSASLFDKDYKLNVTEKTWAGWVIHGGYSADEPNLYASVRHFYDPLTLSGKSWLTDQICLHGTWNYLANSEIPQISAKSWGINHPDNLYSFEKAMDYYQKAMSIKETQIPVGFITGSGFRSRYVKASSLQEERSLYLAAAFRSLGETLHMLADMTQPAHVRNDSHPKFEPLEQTINQYYVRNIVSDGFLVDPEIGKYFISASGGERYPVETLFEETSRYTNRRFFSADTIYDKAMSILPKNGVGTYPSPQLSNLISKNQYFKDNRLITGSTIYFGLFDGIEVPLARVDLIDRMENGGLFTTMELKKENFNIPPTMALRQGEILIPAAIAACSDLMDRFFPTLELTVELEEPLVEKDNKNNEKAVYPVISTMTHHIKKDINWNEAGLEIKYSGPGTVIIVSEDRSQKEIQVGFVDGVIAQVLDHKNKKKLKDSELKLFVKQSSKTKLTKEEQFFEVFEGDMVYVRVEAGGRQFESNSVFIGEVDRVLDIIWEPEKPVMADEITLSTELTDNGYFVWDLGDGTTEEGDNKLIVKHKYNKGDKYNVSVICYSNGKKEKIIARGNAELSVGEKFNIAILPGNNLEAAAKDTVEISAVPAESNRRFDGLTIKWILDGAASVKPDNSKVQFQYNDEGRYTITVQALDKNSVVAGEGKAVIDITKNERKLQVSYPSEIGFLDGFEIRLKIDDQVLRKQIRNIEIKASDSGLFAFCSDKASYYQNECRLAYEGEDNIVFYGKTMKFPNEDTKAGINISVRMHDNSKTDYKLDIMVRDVTYDILPPDSGVYDQITTHRVELNKADEGGSHEGTTTPYSWFYYTNMADTDGYSEDYKGATVFVQYIATARYVEITGKFDKETARELLLKNKSSLRILRMDHLENVSEEKYEQGELPDSFLALNHSVYGFYAKSFDALEVKKSYNNPVKTQAGEQVYTVRMIKEYYVFIGDRLFNIYTLFAENTPASQIDAAYARLESQCDSVARTFRTQTQAMGEYITLE